MNEQNCDGASCPPINTWKKMNLLELIDVRVRVHSAIAALNQSLGQINLKEAYGPSARNLPSEEKPFVTDYAVDGQVAIYEDCIGIRYEEPAFTGMQGSETRLVYWPSSLGLLDLSRSGEAAFHCNFDLRAKRQTATYRHMLGELEPVITLRELANGLERGIGRLSVQYLIDFPGVFTEQITLRWDIRPLRASELKNKRLSPKIEDEEKLRYAERDLKAIARFEIETQTQREEREAKEQLSEFLASADLPELADLIKNHGGGEKQ